ncbi:GDP-mannose 4,6-dehydratase [Lignipirellula cremea]|uniref:GDP-mannose 4,6-dehydratase n=1 Tax=Lignipirellula cremea TaxID=2528010 RepID=A0A518DNA6_9BACT|nr:GDP-mannose 4,6-dehydratase [Lignipirellula cremea]QDU93311.1 GDP-mannose 4,6-dehydratase [Lignipirellula cremea]
MTKRALITGITGQDGSYLAELLLKRGYEVHGLVRRVALEDPANRLSRIDDFRDQLHLHAGSLESFPSLFAVVNAVQPDELYHLGAQSFVSYSFEDAFSTFRTNIDGTHFVLESVKQTCPGCRVYFAGSSEMFGHVKATPQDENTPFHPRSPYGISKVTGFDLSRNYREAYGMFISCGILFNHESPRRGFEFVTRKITSHVAKIKHGLADTLPLGNLEAKRDWGFAGDYVEAMYLMVQQETASDFVVATGETHTVREFCEQAFAAVDLDYRDYVTENPEFYRPAEVHLLLGDAGKAKAELNWEPTCRFDRLVEMMIDADMELIRQQRTGTSAGE